MMDLVEAKGIKLDIKKLANELGVQVIPVNPRKNTGLQAIKRAINETIEKNNSEAVKNFVEEGKTLKYPNYISFNQYLYAEEHACRNCRKFVKEYDRLISHSAFVHLFDHCYYCLYSMSTHQQNLWREVNKQKRCKYMDTNETI
mgnify:CR=1 FL=1